MSNNSQADDEGEGLNHQGSVSKHHSVSPLVSPKPHSEEDDIDSPKKLVTAQSEADKKDANLTDEDSLYKETDRKEYSAILRGAQSPKKSLVNESSAGSKGMAL